MTILKIQIWQNRLVVAAVNFKGVKRGVFSHKLGLVYQKTTNGVILPVLPCNTVESDFVYFGGERLPEIASDDITTTYKYSEWSNDLNHFEFDHSDCLRYKGKNLEIKGKGLIKTKFFKLVD